MRELRQARINLKDAEKARERTLVDSEQTKNHSAGAESSWHREVDDLRVSLEKALATNDGEDESTEHSMKDAEAPRQSTIASEAQPPATQRPGAVAGGPTMTNERPQPSTSAVSDATSQGLAEDLLQKLTDETKQRRSNRQALSFKVRPFTLIHSAY